MGTPKIRSPVHAQRWCANREGILIGMGRLYRRVWALILNTKV